MTRTEGVREGRERGEGGVREGIVHCLEAI